MSRLLNGSQQSPYDYHYNHTCICCQNTSYAHTIMAVTHNSLHPHGIVMVYSRMHTVLSRTSSKYTHQPMKVLQLESQEVAPCTQAAATAIHILHKEWF